MPVRRLSDYGMNDSTKGILRARGVLRKRGVTLRARMLLLSYRTYLYGHIAHKLPQVHSMYCLCIDNSNTCLIE